MYTVLVIYQVNLATMFYTRQFETHEEAQQFRTSEVEWNEESHLYKGTLSDDEAITEYLD
jgi:hypothetical protein